MQRIQVRRHTDNVCDPFIGSHRRGGSFLSRANAVEVLKLCRRGRSYKRHVNAVHVLWVLEITEFFVRKFVQWVAQTQWKLSESHRRS